MEKKCGKCREIKSTAEFHRKRDRRDGLDGWCKVCVNARNKKWKDNNREKCLEGKRQSYLRHKVKHLESCRRWAYKNKEKVKDNHRKWVRRNKDKIRANQKRYYDKNKDKINAKSIARAKQNRIAINESHRKWRKLNPEKASAKKKRYREKNREIALRGERRRNRRRLATLNGRLNNSMGRNICVALKGKKAGRRWESLVDYTLGSLVKHLEKLFQPGMSWSNYGSEWHLEHKIPKAVFNFSEPDHIDFKRCWSLKNLQPMWKKDNLRKGVKIEKPFQPSLQI